MLTATRFTLVALTFLAVDVALLRADAGLLVSLVLATLAAEGLNEMVKALTVEE
ncbi:MAG: hypothetical protein JNM56_16705 [Planctomycetia bacterium]|nr:hypothetical protein [Planctomycetia bacterium]